MIKFPEEGITIQELFEYWLNVIEPPSRYFMEVLSYFVKDEQHISKLREFCSKTTVKLLFCFISIGW